MNGSRVAPSANKQRMKRLRLDRRMRAEEVAQKAGISVAQVYRLEAGERPNVAAVTLARPVTPEITPMAQRHNSVAHAVGILEARDYLRARGYQVDDAPEAILAQGGDSRLSIPNGTSESISWTTVGRRRNWPGAGWSAGCVVWRTACSGGRGPAGSKGC